MKENLVFIVLLNYNGYKETIECVNSIRKIRYSNYQIVIVDNNSSDNSEAILRSELKDCVIIQSGDNRGFAAGNNIGIRYALENNAEYVLLINNDTLVKEDFLINMMKPFKDKQVGLVGSKIMYYPQDNYIWYGGGYINWFKFISVHEGENEEDKGQHDKNKEIDFMTGCCMLIKREVFEKVGYLPEEYFMYYEDVDFCVKVKELGFKIMYNPEAVIYHKVSISSGGEESPFSIKWNTRNRIIFMDKHKHKVSRITYLFSLAFFYLTRILKYIQYRKTSKQKASALLEGIKEGRKNL